MPLFRYQAISSRGKKTIHTIDADDLQDARQKLIRLQIPAIQLVPWKERETAKAPSKPEVLLFTRELARLLHAGLPLFEALSAMEEKYRGEKSHRILLDLCERIKTGHTLSASLGRHSKTFDVLYVSMIANAEKTGRLAVCLEELSQLISRQLHVRKQIISALLYPSLLAVFCLVVLSSLLFFVVPSLRELFEGRDLHLVTRIVFSCSALMCHFQGYFLLFGALLLFLLAAGISSRRWKAKLRGYCLKMPGLKNLYAKLAFVRFARASAALLEGGLPLITVLAQSRTVMGHPSLEHIVARAEERIAQGEPLSATFANHPLIPPLIPRMLGIAEQSGKLSFTMQQIAQIYEDELETTLTHFAAMAQPALLLFLGALVGFVLLSVLLPLTDVGSFVN